MCIRDRSETECQTSESCILIEEIDLESERQILDFDPAENAVYGPVEMEWSWHSFESEEYECFNEDPPSPEFNFADTLCQGECSNSANTFNELAQFRSWTWQSPTRDSIILDNISISLCFEEAGVHSIEQQIWVLGCDYIFTHDVIVLEEIQAAFESEVLCVESPIPSIMSNRSNVRALWSDGEEGLERELTTSGFYEVTLTDGFCSTTISADFVFSNEIFNEDDVLQLPQDTQICRQSLPFEFNINTIGEEEYFLQNSRIDPKRVQLFEAGRYRFRTEINGCLFEKEYILEVDECLSQVYLPTAFSPNADGINDTFGPMGKNFEVISLQIFDRWGNQLHDDRSDWDGKFKSKNASTGVYVFYLEYINLLSGETESEKGTISIIR